jgi:hypothetical protein
MDKQMAEDLGIFIDSNDGEVYPASSLRTLSSSFEDVASVFLESDEITSHLYDYMLESTNSDGASMFLEWPYVHYLSTHSNSTGCSSLTTCGLDIPVISGTHTGASKPS